MKLIIAIIINILSIILGRWLLAYMGAGEYSAYFTSEELSKVSWLGYIPCIILCIVILIYEKDFGKEEFTSTMLFFLWAHASTLYISIGLGVYRLIWCFFPVRIYMLNELKEVINRRFTIGVGRKRTVSVLFNVFVFFDAILYMIRTINNGALPLYISF